MAFGKDFGTPFYAFIPDEGLAYLYGGEVTRIERFPNGESSGKVENVTHYFRGGETTGQPTRYDAFEEGLYGAERSAQAVPIYHPASRQQVQNRVADVLAEMRESDRDIIRACFYEGQSVNGYAKEVGLHKSSAQDRLKTALRNFTKALAFDVSAEAA